MTKSTLQQQLETLSAARYPLHMPGHKRRVPPAPGLGCYAWDLTEIDGADDLHDADGILADAMARTAALYGARRCWYLVGGSTVGLLAGIRALAPFGSTVIAARNCHKAVYHAIELGQLTARWLTPPVDPQFGIYGSVRPADVAAALDAAPDACCVILTSPTYEGVLSDIRTIAEICHARGVPLLVDEAHGAHYLPFAARYGWRGGAVAAGADLVVQSAHKTLPSLTQTAFLQLNGDLADPAEVERQLDVFETSSPSYPLMVSLDGCTRWLADEGEAAFAAWRARLDAFDAAVRDLKNTKILCCGADALTAHPDFFAHDSGKILLQIGAAGAAYLRADGFEPEMVCGPNVLAMTSPCDDARRAGTAGRCAARLGQNGGPARGPAAYSARPRHGPLHDCRGVAAPRAGRKDAGCGGGDRRGVSLGLSPRRAAGGTGRGSDGRAGDGLPCLGAGRNRAEAYGRQRGGGDCGFAVKGFRRASRCLLFSFCPY